MEEREKVPIRMAAVLSAPTVGWNPHWGCVQEAFHPWGIPIRLGSGAYWHQTMQTLLEEAVRDNLDWVLTLDYDSLFTKHHVQRLIDQMAVSPHIDALAALQVRRGSVECPLLNVGDNRSEVEFNGKPVKVRTAHFGMTMIRVEKLRDLPKPWFLPVPGTTGSYDDSRIDADINFWLHWKEHGRTVYVDPDCRIGHLQPMVAEFAEETAADGRPFLVPKHTHVHEWRTRENGVTA